MSHVADAPDEEEEVADDKPRSLIFHLVKQLTKGQDLTRVLIPTFFLEPRSLLVTADCLERMCMLVYSPPLYSAAANCIPCLISFPHVRAPTTGEVFRPLGSSAVYSAH